MKKNTILSSAILVTFLISIIAVSPVSAATVGLVAEWKLDDSPGSVVYDTSGNINNGMLSGGKFGNALLFDGVSSYVSVPTGTLSISGHFTVEAWIYRNALGDLQYVLSKDDGPSQPGSNYNLLSFSGNKVALFLKGLTGGAVTKGTAYFDTGGGGIVGITSIGVDGLWHHVAGVFTGTTLQVYLDGVLDGSVAVSGIPYTNTAELWIGNRKYSAGYFNGKIDEVRISNVAITSFDLDVAPAVDPITTVALWHFDESVGTTVFDETLNNNDGTIHGAAWAGPTWVTGYSGNALRFDGVDDYVRIPNAASLEPTTLTLDCWVKSTNPGKYSYIISKDLTTVSGASSYALYTGSTSGLYFYVKSPSGSALSANAGTGVWDGEWHQVIGTFDGVYPRLYVDGVEVIGSPGSADEIDYDGLGNLLIGTYSEVFTHPTYDFCFNGDIDEIKIYNIVLTGLNLAFDPASDSIAPINTDANLKVCLKDAYENTVMGMTVTLTASAGLTLSSASGTTGTDGCYTFTAKSANTGVYTITATVSTLAGDVSDTWTLAIYPPGAGFVTGGGWIYSDAGNYAADPELEGKATFGFVSKYKKGATVPTGNTEFIFHAAGFKFSSTSYQWLVINGGTKAMFKGEGEVNGEAGYKFMLTADDGGKTGVDTFRIKITHSDAIVYDNGAQSPLGGGSIIVHTK